MQFTNDADGEQPVGLGWHPYFPKRPRSRLHIELSDRWDTDATQLPTRKVAQPGIDSDLSHLDFDNCFEGWRGPARIRDETLLAPAHVVAAATSSSTRRRCATTSASSR